MTAGEERCDAKETCDKPEVRQWFKTETREQPARWECTVCGRVVEFVSAGIAALQTEICRAHGFVPTRHTLQIAGLCNVCAAESGTSATSAAAQPLRREVPAHV